MHVRFAVCVAVRVAVCVAECVVVCVKVRVDSLACTGRVLSRCMCLLQRAVCLHRIEPGHIHFFFSSIRSKLSDTQFAVYSQVLESELTVND